MICPSCGAENKQTANFCSNCGFALVDNAGTAIGSAEEAPCRVCSSPVPVGAQFCGNCGATDPHATSTPVPAADTTSDDQMTNPRAKAGGKAFARLELKKKRVITKPPASKPASKPAPEAKPATEAKPTPAEIPPPPKTRQPGSPVAVPEGWPDVTEELAEVRFYLLQEQDEEAKEALEKLQERFPGHPDLETDLVLDRSVMRAAPTDPAAKPDEPDESAQTRVPMSKGPDESAKTVMVPPKSGAADPEAKTRLLSTDDEGKSPELRAKGVVPQWTDDPDELAKTTVPASARGEPQSVSDAVSATVVTTPPEDDPDEIEISMNDDEPDEDASGSSASDDGQGEAGFPVAVVAKSSGWGDAPAPGGTVISRAPSRPEPNVLPVGSESQQVQLTDTSAADPAPGDPDPVKHEVSATVIKASPKGSSPVDEPPPTDRTIVSDGLQQPKPFGGERTGEWLEGGRAEELVVARPARRRGLNTTMVPRNPDRPAPPTPFGGEVPPGSTMVPGTTPPKGGFPQLVSAPADVDFEHRLPLAARRSSTEAAHDDDEELATAEVDIPVPDPDGPMTTPLPHVPTTQEIGAGPGADPPTTPELRVDSDETTTSPMRRRSPPGEASGSQTPQGTVITANPLPPAPYEGRPPSEILPVRLVMLGARGQPVAERTLAPGDGLEVGRDLSEPWGDDEYLEQRHTRLQPAPGGGVMIDESGGVGAVYRQVEHRRQIRTGDSFRVGQSLVTFLSDERGTRLEVLVGGEGEPDVYTMPEAGLVLGRDEGDVTFPEDTYVSSSHCRFTEELGTAYVEDLGSSNGTYVRVRPEDAVEYGALLLLGHTQFRIQAVPPE